MAPRPRGNAAVDQNLPLGSSSPRHGATEDTSALWVSAAIGHVWGMLSTQTVRSLASLGAVCILRLPCPMAALSLLGHDGLPSSRVLACQGGESATLFHVDVSRDCTLLQLGIPASAALPARHWSGGGHKELFPHARASGVSGGYGTAFAEAVYADRIP